MSDTEGDLHPTEQPLHIVRRILYTPSVEIDWRRDNVFYTLIIINTKPYKLIINSGNSINGVSLVVLARMGLTLENYPKPYRDN